MGSGWLRVFLLLERNHMPIMTEGEKAEWLRKRTGDVTSTEVAALFDCSPYLTRFELFHRKRDKVVVDGEASERMKWGNRLEAPIALGIAEDKGWDVRPMKEYMRDATARIGASFDYAIDPDGILEVKNVDQWAYKDGWIVEDDGRVEAPPHIELQVQTQLMVSGRAYAYIGALVGGNRVALMKREPEAKIQEAIRREAVAFWKSVDDNQPPTPDFIKDAEFIKRLYSKVEEGKIIDAKGNKEWLDLALMYKQRTAEVKLAENARDEVKSKIRIMMGDAEKVQGDGFSISAGMVSEAEVKYLRPAYRNFNVFFKKEKGDK